MRGCGMFTGILFSRKPCPEPAATTCGRCQTPICKKHVRPQRAGPFLCPTCDAYQNDNDWRYSSRDNSWRYRDRDSVRVRTAENAPAAAAGAAAAGDLADEDKAGLSTNAAGAWSGPDDTSPEADGDTGDDGDFDAS